MASRKNILEFGSLRGVNTYLYPSGGELQVEPNLYPVEANPIFTERLCD
jgi:hypothetical protein